MSRPLFAVLAAGLALSAAPVLAQSLSDTHEVVPMPSGKTVMLYRPIARNNAVARCHHEASKAVTCNAHAALAERSAVQRADADKAQSAQVTQR